MIVRARLVASVCLSLFGSVAWAQSAAGLAPRYTIYAPPAPLGESAAEPSIGLNVETGRAMFISGLQTLRITRQFAGRGWRCVVHTFAYRKLREM